MRITVALHKLRQALEASWSAETAYGDWDAAHPEAGQCAVTALIVQDFFGGELLRCPLSDGNSHYWNRLPDGREVDLTSDQLTDQCAPLRDQMSIRKRATVLAAPGATDRYRSLRQRVDASLDRASG